MWTISLLLIWNSVEANSIFKLFKMKHSLFEDRYSFNMGMAISMTSSFVIALDLHLLLPKSSTIMLYLIPLLTGLIIGWKFGAIIKSPSPLTGIYNGTIGAIMGIMLGSVLLNPALCNIPIETEEMISINMYSIAVLAASIHSLISNLIRLSFRV